MTVTSEVATPRISPRPASLPLRSWARAARVWRALRTGLAFVSFGVGAIAVAALVCVSARGAAPRPQLRAQGIVHRAFQVFAWWMRCLGLLRASWVDAGRLGGS